MYDIDFDKLVENGMSPILAEELKAWFESDADSDDLRFLCDWIKIMYITEGGI